LHGGTVCHMMQTCCLPMYHPLLGDTIINSLGAYLIGAGRTQITHGKQTEKDGGKTEVERGCDYVEFLFHFFPVGNTENDCAKNNKGHVFSRLTRRGVNDTIPIWHSCIWRSF
jgi:hypothetical protein